MALAGNAVEVYCNSSASFVDPTNLIDGINNIDWGPTADLLDTTDFSDTTGFHSKIIGLKDLQVTLSGDYEAADTPQLLLRTSWASGADVYVQVLWNGTAGFYAAFKVQDYSISASFDGKVEFSCTLMANSAITTV